MNQKIALEEIEQNTFFWKFYFSWTRGYDEKKGLNIGEALEVIKTDETDDYEWEMEFFNQDDNEDNIRYIEEKLTNDLDFTIEFAEYEIFFLLNYFYIGNLSGNFEAWFFTLEELLFFEKQTCLFLLFLPMTGITENEKFVLKPYIVKHLRIIPQFETHSEYIADCLLNGLVMKSGFEETEGIGLNNLQNHSVRNITANPDYKENVIELNKILAFLKK